MNVRKLVSKEMFPTPGSFFIFVAYMALFVSQGEGDASFLFEI